MPDSTSAQANPHPWLVLWRTEIKLRLRRTSTLVVMLAVIAISWAMIPDPNSGMSLIAVNGARVLNSSSAMAFGSASLASILLGLGSFYLTRGRMSEDLRCGVGTVIAATSVRNAGFLLARFSGSATYVMLLVLALLGTTLCLHGLRGEGPIQLGIYLQTYGLLLVPMVLFGSSCALLFDSVSWLMGKLGDVLFFFIWIAQFVLIALVSESSHQGISVVAALDFSGLSVGVQRLQSLLGSSDISIGVSSYNPALAALSLPANLWDSASIGVRVLSAVLAPLPMLLAIVCFHRYSPDRVKASQARKRRTPLSLLNTALRPLAQLAQPGFAFAARVPGIYGQTLADMVLCLTSKPVTLLTIVALWVTGALIQAQALPTLLAIAVAAWGVLISSISTTEFDANTEALSGTAAGGATQRYLRHFCASTLIGLLFIVPVALRWLDSGKFWALLLGVLSFSAWATFLGHTAKTARAFLALFLFWLYACMSARTVPMLDLLAINGVVSGKIASGFFIASALVLLAGLMVTRRRV
jgi:hypothetical protein